MGKNFVEFINRKIDGWCRKRLNINQKIRTETILDNELKRRRTAIKNLQELQEIAKTIDAPDEERDSILDEIRNIEKKKNVINIKDIYNRIDELLKEKERKDKEIDLLNSKIQKDKRYQSAIKAIEREDKIIKAAEKAEKKKSRKKDKQVKKDFSKELDSYSIKELIEKESSCTRDIERIEQEIYKYNLIAEEIQKVELNRFKKYVRENQALTIFGATTIIALLGTVTKLFLYYITVAKFHYWSINLEDISVFGNGIDSYINYGLAILILILYSVVFNKSKWDRRKGKLGLDKGEFYFFYIPMCMSTSMMIVFTSLLKLKLISYPIESVTVILMNVGLNSLNVPLLYILILKKDLFNRILFGHFFLYNIILSYCSMITSKFSFLKFFIIVICAILLYYVVILVLVKIVFFFLEEILYRIIKLVESSRNRTRLSEKITFAIIAISILLPLVYALNLSLVRIKTDYTIIETELPNDNEIKKYVVLLEHKNQYYVSEFETKDEDTKIFNGEYRIISKEGVKIRNQQFSKLVKTDRSRDEYLEMQNQVGEFYSYIFSRGNPKLEKVFPSSRVSTDNK